VSLCISLAASVLSLGGRLARRKRARDPELAEDLLRRLTDSLALQIRTYHCRRVLRCCSRGRDWCLEDCSALSSGSVEGFALQDIPQIRSGSTQRIVRSSQASMVLRSDPCKRSCEPGDSSAKILVSAPKCHLFPRRLHRSYSVEQLSGLQAYSAEVAQQPRARQLRREGDRQAAAAAEPLRSVQAQRPALFFLPRFLLLVSCCLLESFSCRALLGMTKPGASTVDVK
jgi:hypothetical protein